MSKRAIDLSQFDDEFRAEQPEERGDYETVPDGKYQVAVEKVELTEAQRATLAANEKAEKETYTESWAGLLGGDVKLAERAMKGRAN